MLVPEAEVEHLADPSIGGPDPEGERDCSRNSSGDLSQV